MKNPIKSKHLFSIFIDFAFMTFLSVFIIAIVFGTKILLFEELHESQRFTVITEIMPKDFAYELNENDLIFDPISKRSLGKIDEFEIVEEKSGIRFIITFTSNAKPKSNALRTKNLWFEYSLENE